jgi:predicted GNAT family N-acyltransferase
LIARPASDEAEVAAALGLRERVFCQEQGVPLEAERDGLDAEALHLVALEDGALIGTCRVVLDRAAARLGRLAVERSARRRGVGAALLAAAERAAAEAGARVVLLHAQTSAEALYARSGYVRRGEPFVEQGIDHVAMEKALGGA